MHTGLALFSSSPASADSVEDFYKGKRIRIVIGYTAGGGYDSYARALARFIGKHVPGQPSVISQNMPGAGSLLATNWLANGAPRDGTVIGAINRGSNRRARHTVRSAEIGMDRQSWQRG
jgi:tripartite-type tricarboxylate transporter receptor subunit TctC